MIKSKFIILLLCAGIDLFAQKTETINYLNQQPPGMVAELFAPGTISSNLHEHSAPAFSPDGTVVLWTTLDSTYRAHLLEMKLENGKWSKPAPPAFADPGADDYYPSFSVDGKKLFFNSRRKVPAGFPEGGDLRIWEVERIGSGWGNPLPFDTTVAKGHDFAHSSTKNSTIYFSASLGGGTNFNICRSEKINGKYTRPVVLPFGINSIGYEEGPCIAPDESFLIFESLRPEGMDGSLDLYISFRNQEGRWTVPVNMGTRINSIHGERFARLSPDGKYLFFGSGRNKSAGKWGFDIYWIDAKVIDEIKNDNTAKVILDQPLGDSIITALFKSDVAGAARSLEKWLRLYPNHVDAIVIYTAHLRQQQRYAEADHLLTNIPAGLHQNANIIMETALVKLAMNKDEEARKLLSPLLLEGEPLRERYIYLSGALLDMRKLRESDAYFEKAMALGSGSYPYYNRARALAQIGEKDRAFAALDKAVELGGYNSRHDYETDTALLSLQADARWKILMQKLK